MFKFTEKATAAIDHRIFQQQQRQRILVSVKFRDRDREGDLEAQGVGWVTGEDVGRGLFHLLMLLLIPFSSSS